MRVRHEDLRLSVAIGAGSQGTIYRVEHSALAFSFPLIYKEFAPKTAVSGAALELMASFRANQLDGDRRVIDERTVWPCAAVVRSTRVCGYVMQAIPDAYMQTILTTTGSEPIPREVQHLFVSDAISRKNLGEVPKRTERFALAREMAYILGFFHKRGLVYGDLSYRNAVYTLRPRPMIMLLDCDAIRFKGQGAAVTQLNSPGWTAPEGGPQTIQTDRYKLALFIMRCLTPGVNAQNRNPDKATKVFDGPGMALLRRGLGDDPDARPSGKEWVGYLDARVDEGGGVQPRTGVAGRPAAPPRIAARSTVSAATGAAAAVRRPRGRVAPYQLPPLGARPPANVQPRQWVKPRRVPSRIRAASSLWGAYQAQGGSPVPGPAAIQGRAPISQAAIAVALFVGLFIVVVAAVGFISTFGGRITAAPTARASTTAGTARKASATSTTVLAPDNRSPQTSALDAQARVIAEAGAGWSIRSIAAGDQNGAAATLGTFTKAPLAWTFILTQPARSTGDGLSERPTRKYTVSSGRVTLVFDLAPSLAAGETETVGLPDGWSVAMSNALASAATARPNASKVGYEWICRRGTPTLAECAWRFTFDGSSRDEVFISPIGNVVITRPTWLG